MKKNKVIFLLILILISSCYSDSVHNQNITFDYDIIINGDIIKGDELLMKQIQIEKSDTIYLNFYGEYINDTFDIFIGKEFLCTKYLNTNPSTFYGGTVKIKKSKSYLIKDRGSNNKFTFDYVKGFLMVDVYKKSGNKLSFHFNNNLFRTIN